MPQPEGSYVGTGGPVDDRCTRGQSADSEICLRQLLLCSPITSQTHSSALPAANAGAFHPCMHDLHDFKVVRLEE